jgi:DNA-binding response OmpR family regulator
MPGDNAPAQRSILVVDDEPHIVLSIEFLLKQAGYAVRIARDGEAAHRAVAEQRPDLILLDVMMPNLDGFEFMRIFRRGQATPVILLTARVAETDKVVGLELGADDYVTKPFGMQELVARIRAVLRRANPGRAAAGLRVGDLALDRATREVTVAGRPVALTPSEFELLATLMESPGRVFTREQLLERLQGGEYEGVERTIDVHVRNLRRKIEPDPSRPRYVETVFGVGYRCRPERDA